MRPGTLAELVCFAAQAIFVLILSNLEPRQRFVSRGGFFMFARFLRSEIRRSNSLNCAVILTILLLLVSVPSLLRAQNSNGSLRGEVQETSAARVAGAQIAVQSKGSSITREATANERGEFRVEGLLPG